MKGTSVEWLLLFILIGASLAIVLTGNQDASLLVAAYAMITYARVSKNSAMLINKNLVLFLAVLLFLILLAYRLMFEIVEIRSYVVHDLEMRVKVIFYGAWMIQMLVIGGCVGILSSRKKTAFNTPPSFRRPSFDFLLVIAWMPLVANLLLYLFFFRGREYVDIYTMGHGPIGLVLKTIYLTYAAIIIMAAGSYSGDRAFRAAKWLLFGFFVVYGLLLNLRSPLLLAILLLVYIHGKRLSAKALTLLLMFSILIFAVIGAIRDPFAAQGNILMAVIVPVFGLGEFADTLRFAIEWSENNSPLWGAGIAGSFLGVTEPLANTYAKMISPDYFDEGGGFGFFILADLVMNFGMIGASIVIFVLGLVLARQYYSNGFMVSYVFLPILFANLFAIVRNDLGSTFRGVIYAMLAVILIRYISSLIRQNPTRSSVDNAMK